MKTSKFPDKLAARKKYASRSLNQNFKTTLDEISDIKKDSDDRVRENHIQKSRKFRIALFATYSSLIAIFAIIVYTAIVLDPKFPF